ncbi:Aste57867_24598 [Aphanomyces stellatus]|uniref:Aste57867_24598 protein n=1 Tax=Aphanomyces stellatus TaxID=120398 RepID=A0A485LR07_9STRA|nr:hypothetical protein As57867_024520 [Aphanomyces stellatus]VFU01236.1 Aste57867_24598 [Aphanomyces stellatus]
MVVLTRGPSFASTTLSFRSTDPICAVFCLANVLSYVFRNLVPAAPVELAAFVQHTLAIASNRVSFYFGLLDSVYIVTFSLSIVVFGYRSKTVRPFFHWLVPVGRVVVGLWARSTPPTTFTSC